MIYSFDNHTPVIPESNYFIAETATIIGQVTLAAYTSIWFGAVLRGDIEPITIGEKSNIQDNSMIHTSRGFPVVLGKGVTVGHHVTLHGCTIGDNCLIGMKATLMDGCEIGDNCIIGAGALVAEGRKIPAGSIAVGAPARVIGTLSEERIEALRKGASNYVDYYSKYLENGIASL